MNNSSKTLTITYSALLCALLCVSAFIKVPLPISPVPLTFQVAIVLIIACLLNPKYTATTILLYILIGLMGIPVFSAGGGISYVVTPYFGYIIGFLVGGILMSFIYGSNIFKKRLVAFVVGSILCIITIYIVGVSYMYMIKNLYMNDSLPISTAIMQGALIFWIVDLSKAILAFIIVTALEKATGKTRRPYKS